MLTIRAARPDDDQGLWNLLEPVIRAGETYALPIDMSRDDAIRYWRGADRETFVAELDAEPHELQGSFYLRANQAGGGSHVANCGYITAVEHQGRGVARQMCKYSIELARRRGFKAIQFNFVVSTNKRAVALWRDLGFKTVGVLPGAFLHPQRGYVDCLVLHLWL